MEGHAPEKTQNATPRRSPWPYKIPRRAAGSRKMLRWGRRGGLAGRVGGGHGQVAVVEHHQHALAGRYFGGHQLG